MLVSDLVTEKLFILNPITNYQQQHAFQRKNVSFCIFTNATEQCKQTVMCAERNIVSVSC